MVKLANKKRFFRRKWLILIVAVVVILAIVIASLWALHIRPFSKKKAASTYTASSNTKGEPLVKNPNNSSNPTAPTQSGNSNWSSENKTPNNTNYTPNPNAKLQQPTGNFVSNHHPNLSGSPAPNTMQSSCVTTPGATCQIVFTQNGVTKSLPAQKTDVGGGVYWNWKLQDIGLTAGTWHIQAQATFGDQSANADDALNLEVGS